MQSPSEYLGAAVNLFRSASDRKYDNGIFSGTINLDQTALGSIELLSGEQLIDSIFFDGKSLDTDDLRGGAYLGKDIDLSVSTPNQKKTGFFLQNLADLLGTADFKCRSPEMFYIAELDYLAGELPVPKPLVQYYQFQEFIGLLIRVCDHNQNNQTDCHLIFLGKSKIEIPIKYTASDLVPLDEVTWLKEHLAVDDEKDQRVLIFKTALSEMLLHKAPGAIFPFLIQNFGDLVKRYRDNYDLFVSNFSFESVKNEIEEKVLDYVQKLNSVISDIQNKLLSIPLALILIGGQIKDTGSFSIQNLVILVGALIFVTLMTFLVHNQEHTLLSIKSEIDGLQERFRIKYSKIEIKIHDSFKKLCKRYKRQYAELIVIFLLVWFIGIMAIYLFDRYTPEIDILPQLKSVDCFFLNLCESAKF